MTKYIEDIMDKIRGLKSEHVNYRVRYLYDNNIDLEQFNKLNNITQ